MKPRLLRVEEKIGSAEEIRVGRRSAGTSGICLGLHQESRRSDNNIFSKYLKSIVIVYILPAKFNLQQKMGKKNNSLLHFHQKYVTMSKCIPTMVVFMDSK